MPMKANYHGGGKLLIKHAYVLFNFALQICLFVYSIVKQPRQIAESLFCIACCLILNADELPQIFKSYTCRISFHNNRYFYLNYF